jgi:hypothetical protein
MTILLPALAVAFAAVCVWLTVRIINRRERWAKWTLGVVVGLPVLYALSFGPACWISSHANMGISTVNAAYLPVMWLYDVSPGFIQKGILRYARFGSASGWYWTHGNEWKDYGREFDVFLDD